MDGEGGDRHPLEDPVGVALEDAAIHERPRVALVRVADHVLRVALGLGDGRPLEARRVACAAAAAQAAAGDLVADLGRGHLGHDSSEGLVPATPDVVVEVLGVDEAEVLGRGADLLREEGGLRLRLVGRLELLEGLHDRLDGVGAHVLEKLAGLGDLHERTGRAQAEAADALDHHVAQAGLADELAEADGDVVGLGRHAAGGLAHVRGRARGAFVDFLRDHAAADGPRRGRHLAHIASSCATRSSAFTLPAMSPSTITAGARLQAPMHRAVSSEAVDARMGHPEGVADVVESVGLEVAERLLGGVQGLDEGLRAITEPAHPGLDDLPSLVVAGRGGLRVRDGHQPSPSAEERGAGSTSNRRAGHSHRPSVGPAPGS